MKRAIIRITGAVQGVNFRYYTKVEAEKLGLAGYVKNDSGGSVLVVAEGGEKSLKKLIDWCREGPRGARVDEVEINWQEPGGSFNNFVIQYN